jgi:excinuclease ABC subunit C
VQVFFFRAGRNYGARTFYPSHDKGLPPGEILEAFIAQFYAGKPAPACLFLSHVPNEAVLLAKALAEQAGHKVTLAAPKLGEKKRLIDLARKNAREALARKLSESSEQAKLLNRVAEIFGLSEAPKRIEVYDNSHISGAHPGGAMIAAGAEGFLKKTYRKFNMRENHAPGDDYAMMEEVLTRRFRRLIEEDPERKSGMWPDLVLIDGGQGQLGKVLAVMEELGLPDIAVIGIAKGPDRNAGRERFFVPGRDEPFSLPPDDPALYYLQRLRDEAHRFAIGAHRAKRVKAIGYSGLEDVPGIGAMRKRALLHHFGSAKAVSEAGIDDLVRVSGISAEAARKIWDYFRG